jgi:hypothetical protein
MSLSKETLDLLAQNDPIPEFLAPDQNLFDQPPFNLIDQLLPDDFFREDIRVDQCLLNQAKALFIRALMIDKNWCDGPSFTCTDVYLSHLKPFISPQYKKTSLGLWGEEVRKFLYSFPLCKEYMFEGWWKSGFFNPEGYPYPDKLVRQRVPSLAGYQEAMMGDNPMVGLADELPFLSTWSDVNEAIPNGLSQTNRYYRLKKSEALY